MTLFPKQELGFIEVIVQFYEKHNSGWNYRGIMIFTSPKKVVFEHQKSGSKLNSMVVKKCLCFQMEEKFQSGECKIS